MLPIVLLTKLGEKLADFIGLTSPKYAYEINYYKKQQERKALEEKLAKENSWATVKESSTEPITAEPITTPKQSIDLNDPQI